MSDTLTYLLSEISGSLFGSVVYAYRNLENHGQITIKSHFFDESDETCSLFLGHVYVSMSVNPICIRIDFGVLPLWLWRFQIGDVKSKGIYDRLPLIKCPLLDIDLAIYGLFLLSEVKFYKSWS